VINRRIKTYFSFLSAFPVSGHPEAGGVNIACLPDHILPSKALRPILPGLTLKEIERRAIGQALERNQGKKVATAKELGIDKNTLRRKMLRFGI